MLQLNPANRRALRWLRRLRSLPLLLWRGVRSTGRVSFLRRLINTYHANRINLSLVFRSEISDWRIRWIALAGVGTFLRNTMLYNAPRMWGGFDVADREVMSRALGAQRGVLVAAQHLGPQRYGFLFATSDGHRGHAAMTEQFVDQAAEWVARIRSDLGRGPQVDAAVRFEILAVEEPTCALKMMRALKRNEVVIFDLDGNIGVGGEERTLEGTTTLSFLGRKVHVRHGMAYLAHRTGAPIVPLITLWGRGGRPELHVHEPIVPAEGESRDEFTRRAMESLYGLLADAVRQHPGQWEMWPHFYKWIERSAKLRDQEHVAERLQAAVRRWEQALADEPSRLLRIAATDAFSIRVRRRWLLIDSVHFRFFQTTGSTRAVLERLHRGSTVSELIASLESRHSRRRILEEVARLELLGLLNPPRAVAA